MVAMSGLDERRAKDALLNRAAQRAVTVLSGLATFVLAAIAAFIILAIAGSMIETIALQIGSTCACG